MKTRIVPNSGHVRVGWLDSAGSGTCTAVCRICAGVDVPDERPRWPLVEIQALTGLPLRGRGQSRQMQVLSVFDFTVFNYRWAHIAQFNYEAEQDFSDDRLIIFVNAASATLVTAAKSGFAVLLGALSFITEEELQKTDGRLLRGNACDADADPLRPPTAIRSQRNGISH